MSCSNNLHGMPGGLSILFAGEETEARGLIKVIQSCELGGGAGFQSSSAAVVIQLLSRVRLFLRPRGPQRARLPCPPLSPGVCPSSHQSSSVCF